MNNINLTIIYSMEYKYQKKMDIRI